MSFWDNMTDTLSTGEMDLGSLTSNIFGENSYTSSLDSILNFSNDALALNTKAEKEKEAKAKIEAETKRINESNILAIPTQITQYATDPKMLFGAIGAALIVIYMMVRGK